jgi:protein-disulfide isomerase
VRQSDAAGSSWFTRIRGWVDLAATLVMIGAGTAVVWSVFRTPVAPTRVDPPPPSAPVSISGTPVVGSVDARIVVVEFSDFQCPFCGKFARETWPELKARYVDTGIAAVSFRNLPLQMHQHAMTAALAAACAAEQGRFWPLHDMLFAHQDSLEAQDVFKLALAAGASAGAYDACIQRSADGRVREDMQLTKRLSVASTPTFFIGIRNGDSVSVRQVVRGAVPLKAFAEAIDALAVR